MENVLGAQTAANTGKQEEGPVTRTIEHNTAKVPSAIFLWAAIGSMGVSLALKCMGKKHNALFIGQWAAPFLLLGVYNKIVKVAGQGPKQGSGQNNEAPVTD